MYATVTGQREVLTWVSNLTIHLLFSHVSSSAVILVAFFLTSSTGDFDLSPTPSILVWAFPCFKSLVATSGLHPSTRTGAQQLLLRLATPRHSRNSPCVTPGWSPRKVLSRADGLSELHCYFPVEPAKSPARTATAVTPRLIPLGSKPRLAPYFTEVVESLPEANERWSTVNWPFSELMVPRRTAPFIQSPLMPISSSTFTFNQIWLGGQFVSDFAEIGWMQAQKENTCLHLLLALSDYTEDTSRPWPADKHILKMECIRSPHLLIWQAAVILY